jgi:outer membrane protein OmpA-like peptidoglycan-associated protein
MDHKSIALSNSLTDLMTSLMVIFILMLVVALSHDRVETKTTEDARERIKSALEQRLVPRFDGVKVIQDEQDPYTLIVVVPEKALKFNPSIHEVDKQSTAFLERFTPQMNELLCAKDNQEFVNSVIIEGHTDATGDQKDNLALSQRRALEVMLKALSFTTPEYEPCFLNITSVSGRGSSNPMCESPGAEPFPCPKNDEEGAEHPNYYYPNAALSRRVEFKIRVKSHLDSLVREQLLAGARQ